MPTSAQSAHGSSDALDAAAPINPAAPVCTSSSAKYTNVRGTNAPSTDGDTPSYHATYSSKVQQRCHHSTRPGLSK